MIAAVEAASMQYRQVVREVEERRFLLPGLVLAGRYWPGEGTPILALHGFLDNANSFAPLARYLPNPILAIDFAGHGKSQYRSPDAHQSFLDHVEDCHRLLAQLGWKEVILLGHSMGAGVASLLAVSELPISRLILLDGLGPLTVEASSSADVFIKALKKRLRARRKKPVYASQEQAVLARTKGFGGLSNEASKLLCQRGLMRRGEGFTWIADQRLRLPTLVYLDEQQVKALLQHISVPSLLLRASEGLAAVEGFNRRIGYVSELKVVDIDGRHHVHMEQPAEVAKPLIDFMRSCQA